MKKAIIIICQNCPADKIEELQKALAKSRQSIEIVVSEHAEHGTVKLIEDPRGLDLMCGAMPVLTFNKQDEPYEPWFDNCKGGKRRTKKEWEL